ncbi:hypothetical protein, partial [Salmonella sp. s51933]|uniref:hypothetical protein n=1 Tax=Salmonella sp. s51933 TaxID=3160127 RepID=UPI003754C727
MKKLEQLAKSGDFQVHYQNTTQENEQYLAVVTVSTVPQLICRGFGSSLEHAFEHAAANALVPLLQSPSGNGQATNGTSQRNLHVAASVVKEEPAGGKPVV